MNHYIFIGKIVATYGVKGQLIMSHQLGAKIKWDQVDVFFMEQNKNSYIPYFPETIRPKSETEARVNLETIDTKEKAHKLLKKNIYLEEALFNQIAASDSNLFYIGFTLYDAKEKELGKVADLIELPDQILARIFQNGNELLIPLTPQTIEKIIPEEKYIYLNLPDGLLDIYRNPSDEKK